jgi:hypothetical protein
MKIKYVGVKPDGETAFKSETGVTWFPGTCEDVTVAMAAKMLKHPDVFAEADTAVARPAAPVTLQPLAKATAGTIDAAALAGAAISQSITLAPGAVVGKEALAPAQPDLDTLTREELHALAKARGIKVHHSSGAASVKAAILAADTLTAG